MAESRKKTNENSSQLKRIAQLLARQAAGELVRRDAAVDLRAEPDDFPDTEYVRPAQVARLVKKSVRTVRRWIKAKTVPSVKIGGSRLIAIADLKRLLSPTFSDADEEANDA